MPWRYEERAADPVRNPCALSARYAEITGFAGETPRFLKLPEEIGELPVEAVGASAFARSAVREALLPATIKVLGGFSFYHCDTLKKLTLYDTISDYSDGAIRQCPALREIAVVMARGNWRLPARLLTDTDAGLCFLFLDPGGKVRMELTFPAFSNEYREDTMARAIHPDIRGAGFSYRACVGADGVDLASYDALFPATAKTEPEIAGQIALGRLMAPEGLREEAEESYRRFLAENIALSLRAALAALARDSGAERELERLAFLVSRFSIPESAMDEALTMAAHHKLTRAAGILMSGGGKERDGARALSLEDW